jgi:hypothetical protein
MGCSVRFAGHPGRTEENRIERLAGQHALRPAKSGTCFCVARPPPNIAAKEKPAGLSVKAQGNDRRQEKH